MNCKKCGSALNPESVFCPVCGSRIEEELHASSETVAAPDTLENFTPYIDTETPVASENAALLSQEESPADIQNSATFQPFDSPKKKKLTKGKKALIISGIAVLLIGILSIVGYFLGWFKSFDERMQDAINEQADSIAEDLAQSLADIKALKETYSGTSAYKIDAKLSNSAKSDVLDIIRENLGSEAAELLNWVNDIGCDADLSYDGDLIRGDLFIRANNQDVTPVDLVIDTKKGTAYMTLSDVNKTAIRFDLDSSSVSSLRDHMNSRVMTVAALELIPEKDVSKKIIASYIKMLLAGVSDTDTANDKVDANGIKPDSDCYQFKITTPTLAGNLKNILEDIKTNKDIEKILNDAEENLEMSGFKNDFYEDADRILQNLSEDKLKEEIGNHLLFKIWIDDDDNFLGLSVASERNLFGITYMSALQNNNYGSAVTIELKGIEMTINTKGSISDGKFNGSTDISALGQTIAVQYSDFDVEKYKNSLTSGTYTIEPPAYLLKLLKNKAIEDITKVVLRLDQKSKTESDLKLDVDQNNEFYCTVNLGSSVKEAKEVNIPNDFTETDSMFGWFRRADLDKITENLDKSGFPYDFLDLIKIFLF